MLEEKDFEWENCVTVYDTDLLELIAWHHLDDDDATEEDFTDAVNDFMEPFYDNYGDTIPSEIREYVEQRMKELAHKV